MTNHIYKEWFRDGSAISRDLYSLVVGDELGHGQFRIVHKNLADPKSVLKFEEGGASFENAVEWEIWKMVKEWPSVAKWFAPCLSISSCGAILVQAKCSPIPEGKYPKKVPRCFSDFKRDNWGLYKGRPVCLDYGVHSTIIISEGIANCSRLKIPKWWDT